MKFLCWLLFSAHKSDTQEKHLLPQQGALDEALSETLMVSESSGEREKVSEGPVPLQSTASQQLPQDVLS